MSLLDKIRRKYAVYCPKCQEELNWYASGLGESTIFKCVACNDYYTLSDSTSDLLKTDIGQKIHEQLKQIEFQEYYNGGRSSEVFGPKWMKLLNRLAKK